MDEHSLLVLMSVFVSVAAIALVIQAGFLFGIYKTVRAMHEKTSRVLPKVESLVATSQAVIEESKVKFAEITTTTQAILETTHRQLNTVESLLTDAASRARVQMDRAEMVLDDAMDRAQDTVAMVQDTVITPIKQINGVAAGLRAAIQYLLRGNRPSPDRATVDEEMFI